jgi:hypothetical protein
MELFYPELIRITVRNVFYLDRSVLIVLCIPPCGSALSFFWIPCGYIPLSVFFPEDFTQLPSSKNYHESLKYLCENFVLFAVCFPLSEFRFPTAF